MSFSTFINGQTVDVKNEYLISSESIEKKYNPKVDSIIAYAKTFLGVPYHYGGSSPSGFDCSGFINYILMIFFHILFPKILQKIIKSFKKLYGIYAINILIMVQRKQCTGAYYQGILLNLKNSLLLLMVVYIRQIRGILHNF
jgi:hypothetical protein